MTAGIGFAGIGDEGGIEELINVALSIVVMGGGERTPAPAPTALFVDSGMDVLVLFAVYMESTAFAEMRPPGTVEPFSTGATGGPVFVSMGKLPVLGTNIDEFIG